MIAHLRGILLRVSNSEIIIEAAGVGYSVFVTKRVMETLPETGTEYSLITFLDVKENSMVLYGFIDEKEKKIFKLLTTVSGISCKTAHTILSYKSFEELIGIITNRSLFSSSKIPGIGPKKIELISLALKDKIFKITDMEPTGFETEEYKRVSETEQVRLEALTALMNLGYIRSEAEKIIREVLKENPDMEFTTEEIIKKSLNYISKI